MTCFENPCCFLQQFFGFLKSRGFSETLGKVSANVKKVSADCHIPLGKTKKVSENLSGKAVGCVNFSEIVCSDTLRLSGKAVAEPRETGQKDAAESAKVSGKPLTESEISLENHAPRLNSLSENACPETIPLKTESET